MKKVLFAITNLEIGGAEKVLVNLVNQLKDKYDITVLTLYDNGPLKENIDKSVSIQSIFSNSYQKMSFLKRKLCALQIKFPYFRKKLLKKVELNYDVVISFLEGPITELLQDVKAKNKIAWIHTDLSVHYNKDKYSSLLNVYQKYHSLVFVSQNSLDKFNEIDFNQVYQGKKQIIYNYTDFDVVRRMSEEVIVEQFSNDINFVVVARLVSAKGIDRLLKVHKKLIDESLFHHIYVVGNGPLKEELLLLQKELGVSDTFHFLGEKLNPYPYMKYADYFLLPSYYEGYPVSLLEAMALNQYILATDISSKEVLKDYPNKVIMENSFDGIYDAMKKIIKKKKVSAKKAFEMLEDKKILKQIIKVIEGEKK